MDRFELGECFGSVACHRDLKSFAPQAENQSFDERLLVLGKKHRHGVVRSGLARLLVALGHSRPLSRHWTSRERSITREHPLLLGYSLCAGRISLKVDPSPSRDSTSTRP